MTDAIGPISIVWPSKALSPNARIHWRTKADAVKLHRAWAAHAVREHTKPRPEWKGAHVTVTFCPPDNRRRDRDNMIASTKAAMDGIADALGIDDSQFVCTYVVGAPAKGGEVLVTLAPREVAA